MFTSSLAKPATDAWPAGEGCAALNGVLQLDEQFVILKH